MLNATRSLEAQIVAGAIKPSAYDSRSNLKISGSLHVLYSMDQNGVVIHRLKRSSAPKPK